jgi:hypothetical protein
LESEIIKSFCGGSRGAVFSKRAPLAAGGKLKKRSNIINFDYLFFKPGIIPEEAIK